MDEPKTKAEMFERKLGPGLSLGRKRNRRQCMQSLSGESEKSQIQTYLNNNNNVRARNKTQDPNPSNHSTETSCIQTVFGTNTVFYFRAKKGIQKVSLTESNQETHVVQLDDTLPEPQNTLYRSMELNFELLHPGKKNCQKFC